MLERWTARTAAAAEDRKAAAERHREFARQLKGDVDALEGKLGGLERQACMHDFFAFRALKRMMFW